MRAAAMSAIPRVTKDATSVSRVIIRSVVDSMNQKWKTPSPVSPSTQLALAGKAGSCPLHVTLAVPMGRVSPLTK